MKKEITTIDLGKKYKGGNPYSIFFCYPKGVSPFILKGGHIECTRGISKALDNFEGEGGSKIDIPCLVHKRIYFEETLLDPVDFRSFKIKRPKTEYMLLNCPGFTLTPLTKEIYVDSTNPNHRSNKRRYFVLDNNTKDIVAKFRRVPRCWIKEIDKYRIGVQRSFY